MSAWAVAGAALGLALCTTSLLTLAYAAVLAVFFDVKASREERWLSAAFPRYAAYQARVGKLIPVAPTRIIGESAVTSGARLCACTEP